MNSMLKKKSGLGFKPKAPQARRNIQASPQLPERSSTAERQSQTPIPQPPTTLDSRKSQLADSHSTGVTATTPAEPSADTSILITQPSAIARGLAREDERPVSAAPVSRTAPPTKPHEVSDPRRRTDPPQGSIRKELKNSAEKEVQKPKQAPTAPPARKVTAIPPPILPLSSSRPAPPAPHPETPVPLPSIPHTPRKPAAANKIEVLIRSSGRNGARPSKAAQGAAAPPVEDAARNQPHPSIEDTSERETRARRTRTAKRKAVEDHVESEPEASQPGKRVTRRTAAAAAAIEDPGDDDNYEPEEDDAAGDTSEAGGAGRSADASDDEKGRSQTPKSKRRKRAVTPENSEAVELDYRQVKMADLARDLKTGKKFEKHDEIKQREKARRAQVRLARKLRLSGLLPPGADGPQSAAPETPNDNATNGAHGAPGPQIAGETNGIAQTPAGAPPPAANLQFEVIDGQIVVNSRSLQVDRHAIAAAEAGDMEQVVEDDFTRLTTSASYAKKPRGSNHWTQPETERFYRALRMFGTNFQMIADLVFPGSKTRRHVKLKFNREERARPRRVDAALAGDRALPIDLDELFSGAAGGPMSGGGGGGGGGRDELESVEAIHEELRLREEEHDAAERRAEEAAAEVAAQKRAELYRGRQEEDGADKGGSGDGGGGDEGEAGAAGQKTKSRRKRGPRKKTGEIDTGFGI